MIYRLALTVAMLGASLLATATQAATPISAAELLAELLRVAELSPIAARAPGQSFGVDRAVCTASFSALHEATSSCEARVLLRGNRGEVVAGRLRGHWNDRALLAWEIHVEERRALDLRTAIEGRFGPACESRTAWVEGPTRSGAVEERVWHLEGPLLGLALEDGPAGVTELAALTTAIAARNAVPSAAIRCGKSSRSPPPTRQ
jgi:hypothetical protein